MNKLSVIQNFKTVIKDPYPHLMIENALPEEIHNELRDTLPEDWVTTKQLCEEGRCYRAKTKHLHEDNFPVAPIWKEFFEYHCSREYFDAVMDIFSDYHHLLPMQPKDIKLDERMGRTPGSGNCYSECQFVRHVPVADGQTTRTPHLDNPREIYAGLLYFKHPDDQSQGGGFNVHAAPKNFDFDRKDNNSVQNHGPVATAVPYKSNMFVMFLNAKGAIHSVEPRSNAKHPRWSINIIGEYTGQRMWR